MAANIIINEKIIEISLSSNMTLSEVETLLNKLEIAVEKFTAHRYSLLNNAEKKSFSDLSAVKALSIGMREILSKTPPKKVAIFRPQGDYHSDDALNNPERVKIFYDLNEAKRWLA